MSEGPTEGPEKQEVFMESVPSQTQVPGPLVWTQYRYAQDWYEDAEDEAKSEGPDSRRREILFAVCFLESYLYEWVLVDVLDRDLDSVEEYFPSDDTRDPRRKWKEVPKRLLDDQRIKAVPQTGDQHGNEWTRLFLWRNGLVRAGASKPDLDQENRPVPTKNELDELAPGWALEVALERVHRLHEAADMPLPRWLPPRT
jgi:hypothetical protein